MENFNHQLPTIVKYAQPYRNGIQSHLLTRHGIGYVLRGRKYLYYGDVRHEINRGDMFYINIGHHYMEDLPQDGQPFEQIVFYYTPDQLSSIITTLSINYGMTITNNHLCDNCRQHNHIVVAAWPSARNFFTLVNRYIKDQPLADDPTAEYLKMMELIYLIVSQPDCCLKSKVIGNIDLSAENFEQTIHRHIFSNMSIEDLARECHKSLTSFKKEFRRHFNQPPHRWLINQRLMHSRLLLISTAKSISEIGNECNFPNTSHYIKLFKKEYKMTPAAYRTRNIRDTSTPDHSLDTTRLEIAKPGIAVGNIEA